MSDGDWYDDRIRHNWRGVARLSEVEAFPSLAELDARAADWQDVGGPAVPAVTLPSLYRAYVAEWEQFPINVSVGPGTAMAAA